MLVKRDDTHDQLHLLCAAHSEAEAEAGLRLEGVPVGYQGGFGPFVGGSQVGAGLEALGANGLGVSVHEC